MRPADVNEENDQKLWLKLYGKNPIRRDKPRHTVGDKVRISKYKTIFEKGYLPNFSEEIFTVSEIIKRRPIVYKIKDYNGEDIDGVFYYHELVKVVEPEDKVYYVEKVIRKRKHKGKKQVLVKWKGYPDKFNQWVDESDFVIFEDN